MSKISNHILENDLEVECAPEALQYPINSPYSIFIVEGQHSEMRAVYLGRGTGKAINLSKVVAPEALQSPIEDKCTRLILESERNLWKEPEGDAT